MKRIPILALACWLCGAGAALAAQPEELTLGAGVHYSEGNYGTANTTSITALTFTGRYDTGRWTFRGSVPYLFVSGSNAVVPGVGRVRSVPAAESSASGLGDVTLSATHATYYNAATRLGVDLTGKIKLATADADERLGTGEHDFGVLAEAYKGFGRLTGFAAIGYTMFGSTPAFPLEDVFNYTLGASYRLDERDTVGASYDERERVAPGAAPQREITGFYSRRLERGWRAQLYFLLGLADGSPDWGAGLSAAYPF
jgi:hypothetical protein